MSTERRALPLIKQIYASALDPSGWNDFVEGLSAEFGGAAVGFSLQVPGEGPPIALYRAGFLDGVGARSRVELRGRGAPAARP